MKEIDYIIRKIEKDYRNRKFVFWGGQENPKNYCKEILEYFDCKIEYYVTVHMNSIDTFSTPDGTKIRHISEINGKASEYYIIAFPKQTSESDIMFKQYGFEEQDVLYIHKKGMVVTKGNYKDDYGNEVSVLPQNVKVVIDGYNNKIRIGNVICNEALKIYCSNNSVIEIGDNTLFKEEVKIALFDMTGEPKLYPSLKIGEKCEIVSGRFSLFSGKVTVGDESTFGKNLQIACCCGMNVNIEKKCMFSHDIALLSGDGHLIYDVNTSECINSYRAVKSKEIYIGEHVWVGLRSVLLNGAHIGKGSVIGANTFIKKKIPNNVICAGNPVKIVRKDIAWSRQPVIEDISLCGCEYIGFTEDGNMLI